jgi:transcriptional regulator with XRE-family HTH domain
MTRMIARRTHRDGDQPRSTALPSRCRAIGAELAAVRQARQLSIETVASTLLLSKGQVVGLESAQASAFYNHDYFRRALRKYMRWADLPVDVLDAPDEDEHEELRLQWGTAEPATPGAARNSMAWAAMAIAAIAAATGLWAARGSWRPADTAADGRDTGSLVTSPLPAEPLHVPPAAPPAVRAVPAAAVIDRDPDTAVRIFAGKATWVYVRYPDNRVVERRLDAGEGIDLGPLPVFLAVGTADSLEVRVEDRPVALAPYIRNGQVRITRPQLARLMP